MQAPALIPHPPRSTARGGPCFFRVPYPCPPHHLFPRQVPVKTGGEKQGPDVGGVGITPKINPPACCKGGAWRVKTRPAPPRNKL